jgi:hypothetical protein
MVFDHDVLNEKTGLPQQHMQHRAQENQQGA